MKNKPAIISNKPNKFRLRVNLFEKASISSFVASSNGPFAQHLTQCFRGVGSFFGSAQKRRFLNVAPQLLQTTTFVFFINKSNVKGSWLTTKRSAVASPC